MSKIVYLPIRFWTKAKVAPRPKEAMPKEIMSKNAPGGNGGASLRLEI